MKINITPEMRVRLAYADSIEIELPDGWKLVPVEPTTEMCEAFAVSVKEAGWPLAIFELIDNAPTAFKAMLAAAPEAPK